MRFQGRAALITGGTSGLGAAVARALVLEGAHVAVCGLHDPTEPLSGVTYSRHDVRQADQMMDWVAQSEQRFGAIQLAVNAAGINHPPAKLADLDPDIMADVMATNALGVYHAMRAQIPAILHTGGGAIVNIASSLSQIGAGWMAAYGASKHGVVGLSLSAALDYADRNIRINVLSPGPMATPMFDKAMAEIAGDPDKYAGGLPHDGPADPDKVAQSVLYLLSDAAASVTGTNMFVDQGGHAQ